MRSLTTSDPHRITGPRSWFYKRNAGTLQNADSRTHPAPSNECVFLLLLLLCTAGEGRVWCGAGGLGSVLRDTHLDPACPCMLLSIWEHRLKEPEDLFHSEMARSQTGCCASGFQMDSGEGTSLRASCLWSGRSEGQDGPCSFSVSLGHCTFKFCDWIVFYINGLQPLTLINWFIKHLLNTCNVPGWYPFQDCDCKFGNSYQNL